jgi:integrase/recombinase XerD
MANIRLSQLENRVSSDKTCPICYKITHNKQWTTIQTTYSVLPKHWDKELMKIKSSCTKYKNIRRINIELHNNLDLLQESLHEIVKEQANRLNEMKPKHLREMLLNNNVYDTFYDFTSQLINEMIKNQQFGNAAIYKSTMFFVRKVYGGRDLTFKNLNYNFMVKAESYFIRNNNGTAGFNVYARTIRAIFNKAIKAGIADRDDYPFLTFKIKNSKRKRLIAITMADIARMQNYETKPGSMIEFAKDMFLFSFYMRGMNLADIAKLRKENIEGDRIHYKRSKSKGDFSVILPNRAKALIEKYEGKGKFGYLFPIIDHSDPEAAHTDERTKLRNINKKLKIISEDLEIPIKLSTYSARHSFAGIAKNEMNVPISQIKEALGHESYDVTEHYLSRFNDQVLDDSFSKMFD